MFKILFLTAALFFANQNALAFDKPPFHLLPDYNGEELSPYLIRLNLSGESVEPEVQAAIRLGERNLEWLRLLNQYRAPEDQIPLSDPNQRNGYPIEAPFTYSPKTIGADFAKLRRELPASLSDVLFTEKTLPGTLPLPEADYIIGMRKVDYLYAGAVRWRSLKHYLDYYSEVAPRNDIRGYYFLKREPNLVNELNRFRNLPATTQEKLKSWLVGLCFNNPANGTRPACIQKLDRAIRAEAVWQFYSTHNTFAETLYQDFFHIHSTRPDFIWRQNQLWTPFRDPEVDDIRELLRSIPQSWAWQNRSLQLQLDSQAQVHIEFLPGVTPQANALAGDTIVMDANVPVLDSMNLYVVQHEFGHILGFPDCYVEFYDTDQEAMVGYQIDVTNIMCSRAGVVQPSHERELKSVYSGH